MHTRAYEARGVHKKFIISLQNILDKLKEIWYNYIVNERKLIK